MAAVAIDLPKKSVSPTWQRFKDALRRHPTAIAGAIVLLAMILVALAAPWLGTIDPLAVSPIRRLRPPGEQYWFGTDMLGRDVYSRVIYGARVSLAVGLAVALLSTAIGLTIGLVTGFMRWLDAVMMRVMDGLMSIPSVLLAIALMALTTRQHAQRHPGDHDRRDPARGAAGARRRADPARAAVRRGGRRRGHAAADDPVAPHPAQHAGAACWCRRPTSAPRR